MDTTGITRAIRAVFLNRKLAIYALIALMLIVLGANLHRKQIWPFGHGYYQTFKDIKKYGSKKKAIEARNAKAAVSAENARKAEEAKKLGDAKNHPNTALHKLSVTRFTQFAQGHLAIIKSNDSEIKFFHLSVDAPALSIGTYNIDKNSIDIQKLGPIEGAAKGDDIFISKTSNKIYVSYVAVDKKTCASLKMAELQVDNNNSFKLIPVYESACTLPPYGLIQAGGKMAEDSSGNLYLTVGDFQKGYLAAEKDNHFGKILIRHRNAGKFTIYSEGHRNPQGLYWDNDTKQLISTEHGPQGGDEINVIEKGKNYGWPFVTYGTPYGHNTERGLFSNKGSAHYGQHDKYTKPMYAFVPSIGIKAITKIPKDTFEFPNWINDYLVASKSALYRVVIENSRVILNEPIADLAGLRGIAVADTGIIIGSGCDGLVIIRRDKMGEGLIASLPGSNMVQS